ncbi:MAG: hypothetical protein ACRCUS_02355 [Anaerovoracaceae bacterium]
MSLSSNYSKETVLEAVNHQSNEAVFSYSYEPEILGYKLSTTGKEEAAELIRNYQRFKSISICSEDVDVSASSKSIVFPSKTNRVNRPTETLAMKSIVEKERRRLLILYSRRMIKIIENALKQIPVEFRTQVFETIIRGKMKNIESKRQVEKSKNLELQENIDSENYTYKLNCKKGMTVSEENLIRTEFQGMMEKLLYLVAIGAGLASEDSQFIRKY